MKRILQRQIFIVYGTKTKLNDKIIFKSVMCVQTHNYKTTE